MKVDLLAIAAHPDDVELTSGGTLLKMAAAGYRTGVLDLTRGETGTRGTPETRAKEAGRAAKVMRGAAEFGFAGRAFGDARKLQDGDCGGDSRLAAADGDTSLLGGAASGPLHGGTVGIRGLFCGGAEKLSAGGRSLPAVQDFVRSGL